MKIKWLPFKEARKIAIQIKLKNKEEWKNYISGKSKNILVPSNPQKVYINQWKGWGNWLGTGNKVGGKRKYTINHNFFKKWSHDMAYVFGLWFADGCICKSRKNLIFSISQHKKDKYLLEKILSIMKSDYPLYLDKRDNDSCCFIQICSPTIVRDIIKLGGKYRKSLDCKFPHIPKKYLPDFIRGEFDGDGCIYYDKSSKTYRSDICSGSGVFIKKLLKTLRENIYCFKSYYRTVLCKSKKNNSKSTIYHLCISTNDTKRLGNFMYQNDSNLKLIRKYNLFTQISKDINICSRHKVFLPYKKAKNFTKGLKIKNVKEWIKYAKSKNKPIKIPRCPSVVYKNKGWINWQNFLGTK